MDEVWYDYSKLTISVVGDFSQIHQLLNEKYTFSNLWYLGILKLIYPPNIYGARHRKFQDPWYNMIQPQNKCVMYNQIKISDHQLTCVRVLDFPVTSQ